ncbi:DUF3369 domain-containing protein [Dongshaea marina]|uniref:DUF3369 domain-containing protein n=1 Tax=Dongshaea marina TaxID=2047966 RepID=UPI000D3E67AF|nr:DUF3369 domain-containing protein [Dongshaea marina]
MDGEMLTLTDEHPSDRLPREQSLKTWKVAVVDDEDDIHSLTRMVIKDLLFFGRKLELYSVHSGSEAQQLLRQHQDIVLVLLDVVMETDHAGLDLAQFIRKDLNNHLTRITLRTGQPGQAPELSTVVNYDINDYKEKTDLTSKKLIVAIYSAIRSYRDLLAIEKTKDHLKKLLRSTHELYHSHAIREFAVHVLEQLVSLLHLGEDALYVKTETPGVDGYLGKEVVVGIGCYSKYSCSTQSQLPDVMHTELDRVREEKKIIVFDDHFLAYFRAPQGSEHLLYVTGITKKEFTVENQELVCIFCEHVGKAFDSFAPKEREEYLHF